MNRTAKQLLIFLMIFCLLAAAGCGGRRAAETAAPPATTAPSQTTAPPQSGDVTRQLSHGGMQRSYLVHTPSGYDGMKALPVVLIYHGFQLSGEEMVRITGFSQLADQEGFLAVYPQGSGKNSSWNGGDCCGEAMVRGTDDVGFTRAIIDDLAAAYKIDRQRIYATGFSNGAIMAYGLACDLADLIAAVAPVGATKADPSCSPGRAVPVLHFHGDKDRLNPYEGGTSQAGIIFEPVKDTIAFWVKQDGCPAQPETSTTGSIRHDVYAPCSEGSAVELYTIIGGEHAWPGGEPVTTEIGAPTEELDATAVMWAFFLAHPLP